MFKAASRFAALLVVAAGLGVSASAALASEGDISTRAFTNHALPLYAGPGENTGIRTELAGGIEVRVDFCSRLWCRIHTGRHSGYAFLYALSFGQGPNSIWWPPEERHGPYHPWAFWGE